MKKMILFLVCLPFIAFGGNLNIDLSKNSLDLNAKDSIIYKFYLFSVAHTNIKFINIYGGEEIIFEKNTLRAKGWHQVTMLSDSLKKHFGDLSSGVYYINVNGVSDHYPLVNTLII